MEKADCSLRVLKLYKGEETEQEISLIGFSLDSGALGESEREKGRRISLDQHSSCSV